MIAVIDYGAGNLKSVCNALESINQLYKVVKEPRELACARAVIIPGVGAAGPAMKSLQKNGFARAITKLKVPVLGICLGLQLFADFSEEDGTKCLSITSASRVKKLPESLKLPQMGWNKVNFINDSLLTKNIPNGSFFYFVHSYYWDGPRKFVLGTTNYGISFPSIVRRKNFYAVQFHPEKSGDIGLQLLRNFCDLC